MFFKPQIIISRSGMHLACKIANLTKETSHGIHGSEIQPCPT